MSLELINRPDATPDADPLSLGSIAGMDLVSFGVSLEHGSVESNSTDNPAYSRDTNQDQSCNCSGVSCRLN